MEEHERPIDPTEDNLQPQNTRLWRRFMEFHEKNPHVYEEFKRYTQQAIDRGFKRISADFLLHIMRWEARTPTTGDRYRLNKIWPSYYARIFMLEHPTHRGIFQIRRLRNT